MSKKKSLLMGAKMEKKDLRSCWYWQDGGWTFWGLDFASDETSRPEGHRKRAENWLPQHTVMHPTTWAPDGSSRHRLPGGQIPTLAHTSLRPWTRCTTFHSMFICNVRMRMWTYRVWEKLHESPVLNEKTSCVWRRIIFQSCYLGALVTGFF